MSTLLHVADADLEGAHGEPTDGPARFFSFRSDEKVRAALGRHGTVECWGTWESASDLHYQFAVLRASA